MPGAQSFRTWCEEEELAAFERTWKQGPTSWPLVLQTIKQIANPQENILQQLIS